MALAIDNLGRKIDTTNMTLDQIKGLVATLMGKPAGAARPVRDLAAERGMSVGSGGFDDKSKDHLQTLRNLFEQYTKDFNKEIAEQKNLLQKVVDAMKDIAQLRDTKKAERKEKGEDKGRRRKPEVSKEEKSIAKSIETLHKHATKKGSLYVHDVHVEQAISNLIRSLGGVKTPAPVTAAAGGGGGGAAGGGGVSTAQKGEKDWSKVSEYRQYRNMMYLRTLAGEVTELFHKVQDVTLGFDAWGAVTQDLIKKEREYTQQVRAVAYETAGVTKESRGLQRIYEDIGSTTKLTGMDRTKFQESYMKALKSGVRDQKQAVALTTAQLNTEHQLGMEAGSLHEDFLFLAQAGRMNNNQIADMGRGMRDVARSTGLTGDALKGVISNSKQWLDSLRSAANLTSAAAKNIIEIAAHAKKLGIEQAINPILSALTSTNKLLFETSGQTQAFLFQAAGSAGRMSDLLNGTLTRSKEGLKDLVKGMKGILKNFGIDSLEQIDQLSDEAKMTLNIQLKGAFGMELGDVRSAIQSVEEAIKGTADKLADIHKKLQQNITLEERATLLEQERALKTTKALEVMTVMSEAAKGAKDMNQALETFGTRRKEFEKDLQAMGISATDNADVMRQTIQSALTNVNAGLKKAGKQELKIDSSEIENALKDPTALRELTARISKGEQQLATAQKAQLDPMSEMAQYLKEINDNMRQFTQSMFSKMFNSLIGKVVAVVVAIAGIGAGLMMMGVNMMALKEQIKGLIRGHQSPWGGQRPGLMHLPKLLLPSVFGEFDATGHGGPAGGGKAGGTPAGGKPTVPTAGGGGATKTVAAAAAGMPTPTVAAPKEDNDLLKIIQLLTQIRDCVCKGLQPTTAAQAGGKAAEKDIKSMTPEERRQKLNEKLAARKGISVEEVERQRSGVSPHKEVGLSEALQRRQAKQEKWHIMNDPKMTKTELQTQKDRKALTRAQKKQQAAMPTKPECPNIPTPDPGCFDIKAMMASGKEMAKVGAAILILAAGVVLLGAAIVLATHKIIKAMGLDLKTVLETAAVVAAIAAAGGAIALAAVEVYKHLAEPETQEFVKTAQTNYKEVLKAAAAILIIGPAVVLLGAAVVAMTQLILSKLKLNMSSVLETAGVVVAVAGVAGAIAVGSAEFIDCMLKLEKNRKWRRLIKNPVKLAYKVAKIGAALLLIGGAVIVLGVSLVKMAQGVLSAAGLDMRTALKVAADLAALILATSLIAGAVIAAAYGLQKLGEFWKKLEKGTIPTMMKGALALMLLAPAVTLLAAALVWITRAILGAFGLDSGTAAKVAKDLSVILLSAGIIALGVIGAIAGIYGLGLLATWFFNDPTAWAMLGWGTLALIVLGPLIALLASAVIKFTGWVMKAVGMDGNEAVKVATNVAKILISASVIALGVIGAIAGLYGLGLLLPLAGPPALWWMLGGALALTILTPAIIGLAAAVIALARGVMKMIGIDGKTAADIAKNVAQIIGSAALIAGAVLASLGALALLGLAMTTGAFWIAAGLAVLGAVAIALLTPAMVKMANAIINMGASLMSASIKPEDAKKTAEDIANILTSAGDIAWAVIKAAGYLAILAPFAIIGFLVSGWLWLGIGALVALTAPVIGYVKAVVEIAKKLSQLMKPEQAVKMAEDVAKVLGACGDITERIMSAKDKLLELGKLGEFNNLFFKVLPQMRRGTFALWMMSFPLRDFIATVVFVAKTLGKIGEMKQAIKVIVFAAALLDKVPVIITKLGEAMDGINQLAASKFLKTQEENTKISENYADWFRWVGSFVRNGIIVPMKGMGDVKEIKNVGRVILIAAKVLEAVPKLINGLNESMMGIVVLGQMFFRRTSEENTKISENYRGWFEWVASFVRYAIIEPAKKLGEAKKLIGVAKIIRAAAVVLDNFPKIVKGLGGAMQAIVELAASKFMQSQEDNTRIANNYRGWFEWVIYFVRNAIIVPSKRLGNVKELKGVAKIICAAATVLTNFPKIIVGLGKAMDAIVHLDSSKFMQTEADNTRIADLYEGWFKWVAYFVRKAIILPAKGMGDVKELATTAKIVSLAARILTNTPRIIAGLGKAMDAINELASDKFLQTSEQNTQIADRYKGWFEWVAYFIRVAIVEPVNKEFPDVKPLSKAARIIAAMSRILTALPRVIRGLAVNMNLMESSDPQKEAPGEKIMEMKDKFEVWFRDVTKFMCDGIVDPILTKLPEPKTIMLAGRILMAMSRIISMLPGMIRRLTALFVPLNPNDCTREAPVAFLAQNAPVFAAWFWQIAAFLRLGIITPIMTVFPDDDEVKAVAARLQSMNQVVGMLPPFLFGMADRMNALTRSVYGLSPMARIANDIDTFAGYFYDMAAMMIFGIILPIRIGFPNEKDVEDIEERLDGMIDVLDDLPSFLDEVGEKAYVLLKAKWRNYFAAMDVDLFAPYFWRLANSLNYGIIAPVQTLPNSDALFEVNEQMTQLGIALDKAKAVLDSVGRNVESFTTGWWWGSNFIKSLKASIFAAYFTSIASTMRWGIIEPIQKYLPSSAELKECVAQIDETTVILNSLIDVMTALGQAMQDIANADIDWTPLQEIPVDNLALFVTAMQALRGTDLMGGGNISIPVEGGEEQGSATPSDKAIERGMMKEQTDSTTLMANALNEFVVQSMKAGGLTVSDAPRSVREASIRPAAQTTADANMQPAAGNADMRPAAETMNESPTQRAERSSQQERQRHNRFTERRNREAAARAARQQAQGNATPSPTNRDIAQNTQQTSDAVQQMAEEATTAGSLFVHDVHVESLLQGISRALGVESGGIEAEATGVATVTPVIQPSPTQPDVQSQVAREVRGTQPNKTEVTGRELGNIAQETTSQTQLLNQLVTLFQQVLEAVKPKPTTEVHRQGVGGERNDTSVKTVVKKPANFYRNPVGTVSQTPGKAVVNLGPQVLG